MTFLNIVAALLVGLILQPAAQERIQMVIVPGKGVAGVKLGSTLSSFQRVFPKDRKTDTDYPDNGCGERAYQWVDIDHNATGIYVYLKNDMIQQFSVQTPRLALRNGLTLGGSEEQVKAAFPGGRAWILLGSGDAAVGGKDLIYWVDRELGVAVGLYWNSRHRKRLIRSIDVFPTNSTFLPEGCVSPPQQWKLLSL